MRHHGGPDDVRSALAAATAAVRATLPERAAVRRYQAIGNAHERLNAFLRGRPVSAGTADRHLKTIRPLDELLTRAALPTDLTVFRGLRRIRGIVPRAGRMPATRLQNGYLSTTLSREVALRNFTDRERGGILRITAPAGMHPLWLPTLGDPRLADEEELLFLRGSYLTFRRWRVEVGTVEVDCEVSW